MTWKTTLLRHQYHAETSGYVLSAVNHIAETGSLKWL